MAAERLVNTIEELEAWLDETGHTALITRRIKLKPKYLVRIVKPRLTTQKHQYHQAVADNLSEALEMCLETYFSEEEVPLEQQGRLGVKGDETK